MNDSDTPDTNLIQKEGVIVSQKRNEKYLKAAQLGARRWPDGDVHKFFLVHPSPFRVLL